MHSNEKEEGTSIQRNATFNLDEIKVRWKKAALENCPSVPCAQPFICGTSSVLDIDGNNYETVAIVGTAFTQCWTTTNLKVTKYNDGTVIPDLTTSTSNPWAPTSGARAEYVAAGVTGYVGTYGYLYNWYAVSDSRKLCPVGWHVPTDAEWSKLVIHLDNSASALMVGIQSTTAGTVMKSTSTLWHPASPPIPGTNTSGFTALPGGYRNSDGSFGFIGSFAFFWSAPPQFSTSNAWGRLLNNDEKLYRDTYNKLFGASVRCLRD